MKFKITVLPGDGVGPEVITEAIKVMAAAGARHGQEFDLSYGKIGGIAIDEFGTALPDETAEMFDGADAILFGAVGGPKWDDTRAAVRPEDAILAMRKNLDAFANLRPVKVYSSLINSSPVKPHLLKGVDIMVVREMTSGLYFGRPKKVWDTSRGRRGVDTLKYTEREIVRILRVGFELAQSRRKLLTSMDKANVLASGRLWREIATEMAEEYSDVELEHIYADNLAMQIIRDPQHYDVIVGENTFGDIISDEAAVLVGSLGMLPSASLAGTPKRGAVGGGIVPALYEPIHGSAPDIVGKGIANPIGTILSMSMMLRHSLGLDDAADAVERSVEGTLAEGYRTPDIVTDGGNVVDTRKMGDVIAGGV